MLTRLIQRTNGESEDQIEYEYEYEYRPDSSGLSTSTILATNFNPGILTNKAMNGSARKAAN